MRAMVTLARLYVVESVRRQVHLMTLFLAILLALLPVVVNTFGMSGFERVTKDFGLTLVGAVSILLALYLGSSAIPGEVERKTHLALLCKPMPRLHYLAGKYLGVALILALSLAFLGLCLQGSLALFGLARDAGVLVAVGMMCLEAWVVAAICLLVSTRSSPVTAGVAAAAVYLLGGLSTTFINYFFVEGFAAPVRGGIVRAVKAVLPRFDLFQIKAAIVHGDPVPGAYLAAVTGYGLLWIFLLLLLADRLFARKDL